MHLRARVPNEGARRLAWWIGARGPDAFDAFAAAIRGDVGMLDRLLSGELLPGAEMAHAIWLASDGFVGRRDWRRAAEGGWFDPVERREVRAA